MEKYLNEKGQVAVLISPGYDCGWSTWGNHEEFMLFDKQLVCMYFESRTEEEVKAYLASVFGPKYICTAGWNQVEVQWIDPGTEFIVQCHDGYERTSYGKYGFTA